MRKRKNYKRRKRIQRYKQILFGIICVILFVICLKQFLEGKKYVAGFNQRDIESLNPEEFGKESETKEEENKSRVWLDVDYICQYPELPTGCEATALTMVLNYYGFDVSKEEIAGDYMEKTEYPGDFINYFMGDPFSEYGFGMYAPALKNTANNFLEEQSTDLKAYDITGEGMDKICEYVSEGYPVCIWTTLNLNKNPNITREYTINGINYQWKSNEHCMVVVGFDREQDTLIIANPAEGIQEYSKSTIEERNMQFDEMAVVIK